MLGEELNSSKVTQRGLIGDRVYAIIDEQTGKVASAKNPGKWGKLFDFRAAFTDSLQTAEKFHPSVLPYQMVVRFSLIMVNLMAHYQRSLVERLVS
jgi:uncharacterized protein YcbX